MSALAKTPAMRWLSVGLSLVIALSIVPGVPGAQASTPSPAVSVSSPRATAIGETVEFSVTLSDVPTGNYFVVMEVTSGEIELAGTSGTAPNYTVPSLSKTGAQAITKASRLGFSGPIAAIQTALTNMKFTRTGSGSVAFSFDISEAPAVTQGTSAYGLDATKLFFNETNGHYYENVSAGAAITWAAAKADAEKRSLNGAPGYLVTLTSSSENDFVANRITATNIWIGATDQRDAIAATGVTTYADQAASEGNWYWVTGPEAGTHFWKPGPDGGQRWGGAECVAGGRPGAPEGETLLSGSASTYQSWACGEPNNSSSSEHYAVTNWEGTRGRWNDLPNSFSTVTSFLVEYSEFPAISEPVSLSTSATFSELSLGRLKTTDFGTVETSGGAYCWRGYAMKMAEDTVVRGLVGGGTQAYSAGTNEFRGALYDANLNGSGLPTSPKSVLAEVTFKGSTVNQEVLFSNSDNTTVNQRPASNIVELEAGKWYYLMQGRNMGSVLHWYVDSLSAVDLVAASPRLDSWLPSDAAPGQAYYGSCGGTASANVGQTLSTTPNKPAVGLIFETTASGLPVVETVDATQVGSLPLSGRLTEGGGADTALYIEYGTALVDDPNIAGTCATSPAAGVTLHEGCNIGSSGLQLYLENAGYSGTVPYVYAAGLGGLNPETRYFYRARAINDAGRVDGLVRSFTTDPRPGAPVIDSASGVDQGVSLSATPAPEGVGVGVTTTYEYRIQLSSDTPWPVATVNWISRSPSGVGNPFEISGLVNGQEYRVQLRAVSSGVRSTTPSNIVLVTAGAPATPPGSSGGGGGTVTPAVQNNTVTPLLPRPVPRLLPSIPPAQAPVLQNNQPPAVPNQPTGLLNGVPTQVQTLVTDPNNLNIRTGVLNIGINVQQDQGLVRQGTNGETEVQVRKGGVTAFQGSGLAPRSFVQVFMPLQGTNARELARIPVDETGSFSGDAVFQTGLQDAPLPIGRHVLQMVTVDEQGRQNVVEIAVNIVQPSPAPEINRENGETPALLPGQSLATNGGVPEVVEVTVIPDQKQTIIEGDGWTMGIAPQDENSSVTENEDGEVLLELVRDESASVSGSGFMPNTRADVWLFSTPTLLGTVDIDENGEFNGTVEIDGQVINVGEHTLQMQGVGMDGYVRAANLGVVVNDAEAVAATEAAASGFLWWWLGAAALVAALGVGGYTWWRRKVG